MELKQRDLILVYGAIGLVGILAVSKLIFSPFQAKLASLRREVVRQETKLKKGLSLLEKKEEINREYDKYASFFSLQDFSDEEAVASFLKEVEKISRESGLAIVDMKPQKETKNDKISKQYNVAIKADGNMEEVVQFLYAIYHSSLLLSVEKLVLSPKTEESVILNITMTVAGITFPQ